MNVLALAAEVTGGCFKRQILISFFERFLVFGLVHHIKKKKNAYFRNNIKEDVEADKQVLLKKKVWFSFPGRIRNYLLEFI